MVGAGQPGRLVAGQPGCLAYQVKGTFGISETAAYLGQHGQLDDLVADCQLGWHRLGGQRRLLGSGLAEPGGVCECRHPGEPGVEFLRA